MQTHIHPIKVFALAMTYTALAILDFERHRLAGVATWYIIKFQKGKRTLEQSVSALTAIARTETEAGVFSD